MKINEFPHHIFWNYKKDADLPIEVVTKNIFLYGDVQDMVKVCSMVERKDLQISISKLEKSDRYKKRVNFIKKVLLDD